MVHLHSEEHSGPNQGVLNLRFELTEIRSVIHADTERRATGEPWSQASDDGYRADLYSPCRLRGTAHQKGHSVNKGQHNIEFDLPPRPKP